MCGLFRSFAIKKSKRNMEIQKYSLTEQQELCLKKGLRAAISIPIIDSIEDFIWESIFCYIKGIPYVDPFNNIRSKKLYDVVDVKNRIGWSAKGLQVNNFEGEFELVIQRADVIKKSTDLGFPKLSLESNPNTIGQALLKHWQKKIKEDAIAQNVVDKRICILLKNKDCTRFAYVEESIALYNNDELYWEWADKNKAGLKGIRKSDNFCVYKWYHNQTQFFERFKFAKDIKVFDIPLIRLDLSEFIELIYNTIEKK